MACAGLARVFRGGPFDGVQPHSLRGPCRGRGRRVRRKGCTRHFSESMDHPIILSLVCFIVLCGSTRIGFYAHRMKNFEQAEYQDLDVITAATLTLLSLIIGFSFSMAVTRYDQRKQHEDAEANTIGTEYNRVGLLPEADALKVRSLLKSYLDQRIVFYTTRNARQLEKIRACTARLQADLWSAIEASAVGQPPATVTFVGLGMNEVLDSEGHTQAAWWNRIPIAAWVLMSAVAICSCFLVGYTARRTQTRNLRFFVLPLLLATAFLLIADLDSPRGGIIHIHPQNLESVSVAMRGPQ